MPCATSAQGDSAETLEDCRIASAYPYHQVSVALHGPERYNSDVLPGSSAMSV
jgi:hypothetical protein